MFVKADAVFAVCFYFRVLAFAFDASVDDVDRHSETGLPAQSAVFGVGLPFTAYYVVTRRFWFLCSHPEPDSGTERDAAVVAYQFGFCEKGQVEFVAGQSVIICVAQLQWSAAVV